MNKLILSLLLASSFGIVTSLILLLTDAPLIFSFYLFISSLIGTFVFFSLKIIQKERPKFATYLFTIGILLVILFVYGIFNSEILTAFWKPILSVLTFLIIFAIDQFLKSRKNKSSLISRVLYWGAGILLILILSLNISNPIYFSIVSFLLLIGSVTFVLSSIKSVNSDKLDT